MRSIPAAVIKDGVLVFDMLKKIQLGSNNQRWIFTFKYDTVKSRKMFKYR